MWIDAPRRRIARALERGTDFPGLGTIAALWGAVAPIARPVVLPAGVRAVTIGGATLGGSGKTPLAIACARMLARTFVDGETSVAFVGHGYGARVSAAKIVAPGDVGAGDEAAEAALALADARVPVVVGPSRQAAVDHAALVVGARVLVLDGPLALAQLDPRDDARVVALLALDPEAPFGSGACPPRGDLRAAPARLVAAADAVVCVGDSANLEVAHHVAPRVGMRVQSRGGGPGVPLAAWAAARGDDGVNVATAIARPERFLRLLARAGVRVERHLEAADHADLSLPPGEWLVPRKNAPRAHFRDGFESSNRVAWVEYDIDLPASLRELLCARLLGPG